MGTWGHGSLENDSALDWLDELENEDRPRLVLATLSRITDADADAYLDADDCQPAVAAAEVVAAAAGRPSPMMPVAVAKAADEIGKPSADLLRTARDALDRMMADSELRELWDDSARASLWLREMRALRDRLD